MRYKQYVSILAVGCLMLAGVAIAGGPKTTVTVTLSGGATGTSNSGLDLCTDELCSDPLLASLLVPDGALTAKLSYATGSKTVAFRGNIIFNGPGSSVYRCDMDERVLIDTNNVWECVTPDGQSSMHVKIGNGPERPLPPQVALEVVAP